MHFGLTLDRGLPAEELRRIDEACDRFESAWRRGERPELEAYLDGFSGAAHAQLIRELLAVELDLRLKQGETPDVAHYHERFPDCDDLIGSALRVKETNEHRIDGAARDDSTVDNPVHASSSLLAGSSQAAGYEILSELGRGGMGIVYKARQIALGRLVALKVIRSAEFASMAELIRFQNEAEAVAHLDHPHIVPIYEVGQLSGQRYFSMKLVQGESLDRRLGDYAAEFCAAARLVATIAGAIDHAHQRGILHRDLKPANILIDEWGNPHVTDFGLARRIEADSELTHSGYPMGTPSYMSPEQARGDRDAFTTATDVYGLGTILYALLTGHAPFTGSSLAETLDRVRDASPEPPTKVNPRVPRDLETICLKCLEKNPQRRYPGARALAEDLTRFIAREPIQARPVSAATRAWMWARRNPLPAALSLLCGLAILSGLIGVTWQWQKTVAARSLAEATSDFMLHKLFDQASPRCNPRGANLTVGELLDRAGSRLKGEFEGKPEVEAAIRRTLGTAYQSLSLYDRAEPHLQMAVELDTQSLGARDRQTLGDVNLLTSLLDDAGRFAEAEPLARKNLALCTAALGPDDPTTLEATYNLGVSLVHLRQLDEAERVLSDCTARERQVLGNQHLTTLRTIDQLGNLLQDRGKLELADALALEYEHGIRCQFGTKHPDNVTALASRARVRLNQGRLDEAELLYQSAAQEAGRILGPDHPRTLAAMADLARVLEKRGRQADAVRVLGDAWKLARTGRGLDDPETLRVGCRFAQALLENGQTRDAEGVLELVVPHCRTALRPDHAITREANERASRGRNARQSESLLIPEDPFAPLE